MPDNASCSSSGTRRLIAVLFLAVVAIAGAVALVDYLRFDAEGRQLHAVLTDLEASGGSILDWPLGKDHAVTFCRPLDEHEVERLAEAIARCRRRSFVIVFRDCDLSEDRLEEIRRRLATDKVSVYYHPSTES